MTAPVPSQWQCTQANATTTLTPTCNVGDLLVVIQTGTYNGSGSTPSAPTSGSGGSWGGGAGTNGCDARSEDGTNTHGRTFIWSKVAASGDSGNVVTVSTTGYTVHRFALIVIPGTWDTTSSARVAQIVDGNTTNNGIGAYGVNNSGTTPALLTDVSVPAIVFAAYSAISTGSVTAMTMTWDGATSPANKFQRVPFADESSSTTTTPDHTGSHYGFNDASGRQQIDYQEYDSSDTITSVLLNNGVSNATHATGIIVYRTSLTIATNLLNAAPTLFQPAVRQEIATNLLTNTPSVFQPIVQQGAFVNTNLLDASPTLFSPAVRQEIAANQLNAAPSVFQPAVQFAALNINANLLNAAPSIFSPMVGMTWSDEAPMTDPSSDERVIQIALTVSKNYPDDDGEIRIALKQNGSFVQTGNYVAVPSTPTEITLTLSSPSTGTGFSIFWEARTFSQLDALVSNPALITESLIRTNLLNNAPTVFSPGAQHYIAASQLNAAPTLFQPGVAFATGVPQADASPTLFAPTITVGPVNVNPTLCDASQTIYTPFCFSGAVIQANVVSTTTLYAPQVSPGAVNILTPLLNAAPVVRTPGMTLFVIASITATYRERNRATYPEGNDAAYRERNHAQYEEQVIHA